MQFADLSREQQKFIEYAANGANVFVDACIGSGKTTAIQCLCDVLSDKRILYLTYNKLLKADAQEKIQNPHTYVTNYHGFAMRELYRCGYTPNYEDVVADYNRIRPPLSQWIDTMIVDEYQDLDQSTADLLTQVKSFNQKMQVVSVGDLAQKLYNNTNLKVFPFMRGFLGQYTPMEFTQSFRMNEKHAAWLGKIWNKTIVGVNPDCKVLYMKEHEVLDHVVGIPPKDLLVLGANTKGGRTRLQNHLLDEYGEIFGKDRIWANKKGGNYTTPKKDAAIFTTYDGCKGMERRVCVIYDWDVDYWEYRLGCPNTDYEILRNVFCVAASRGKQEIIFVIRDDRQSGLLADHDLMYPNVVSPSFSDCEIQDMFSHKHKEDVEDAYHALDVKSIEPAGEKLPISLAYGTLDLTECLDHYIKATYFKDYDIDREIRCWQQKPDREHIVYQDFDKWSLQHKVQYLLQLQTLQNRYMNSIPSQLMSARAKRLVTERLAKYIPDTAPVQITCDIPYYLVKPGSIPKLAFTASGYVDAFCDNIPWLVVLSDSISHEVCLQMGIYLCAMYYKMGRVYNLMTGEVLEITVPDRQAFLDRSVYCTTAHGISHYHCMDVELAQSFIHQHMGCMQQFMDDYDDLKRSKQIEQFFASYNLKLPISPVRFLECITDKYK